MIYITGDLHGDMYRILEFSKNQRLNLDDIFILLGDVGINMGDDSISLMQSEYSKELLSKLPCTFFCIHGNHEQRPENIASYKKIIWNKGNVYQEEKYPNILFAEDGEIFNINGAKFIVLGGAYSIDKHIRLRNGYFWCSNEQMSEENKKKAIQNLKKLNWKVDAVLSHTCPYKYEPKEKYLKGYSQAFIDKRMEMFLDRIENDLSYDLWYCGHWHTNKDVDKV